jgi:hypothetical protein
MTTPPKKQLKPWERFDPKDAKPSAKEDLHKAIGATCASWSMVEHNLFQIFRHIFAPHRAFAAWKMYATIPTTASRVNYIKAAAEAVFINDKERLDVINNIMDDLVSKFSSRRNDIAHGMLFSLPDNAGFVLGEPVHNLKNIMRGELGYRYDSSQIAHYIESFDHLSSELNITRMLVFTDGNHFSQLPWPDTPLTRYVRPKRERLKRKLSQQ